MQIVQQTQQGWTRDGLGNLIIRKGKGRPRRVVACAMDTPTFAVSEITDDGYLRLHEAGNWGPRGIMWDSIFRRTARAHRDQRRLAARGDGGAQHAPLARPATVGCAGHRRGTLGRCRREEPRRGRADGDRDARWRSARLAEDDVQWLHVGPVRRGARGLCGGRDARDGRGAEDGRNGIRAHGARRIRVGRTRRGHVPVGRRRFCFHCGAECRPRGYGEGYHGRQHVAIRDAHGAAAVRRDIHRRSRLEGRRDRDRNAADEPELARGNGARSGRVGLRGRGGEGRRRECAGVDPRAHAARAQRCDPKGLAH